LSFVLEKITIYKPLSQWLGLMEREEEHRLRVFENRELR
jgi:hypothetical protein